MIVTSPSRHWGLAVLAVKLIYLLARIVISGELVEVKHRGIAALGITLLFIFMAAIPMASGEVTSGGIPCNEFPPTAHFGVLTSNCSNGDQIAADLLTEAGTLGVMGKFNQTNDTVAGRFARFDLSRENGSITSYAVWSNGALYQTLDIVQVVDSTNMAWKINGPVFNGTFDSTTIRILNHISGLMVVTTEKSVRIKLTMANGVNAMPVNQSVLAGNFTDAMYMRGNNVSSAIMVKDGSIETAGNRSVFVDLAKGGTMVFRAAPADTSDQAKIIDEVLGQAVAAEYWVLARDDGAIYDVVPFGPVDFNASNLAAQFGDWAVKLPVQAQGKVVLIHTDKMSLTFSGGVEKVLTMNGTAPKQAQSVDEVFQAVGNNSTTPLYFQSVTGSRVDLVVYVPGDNVGTNTGNSGGGATAPTSSALPMGWLLVGGVAVIAVIAGGVLLVRRSRKK